MNKLLKKSLVLTLVVSLLLSFTLVFAFAAPATYSSSKNSGTRDEVCTTLAGTSAGSYYTGKYTYDNLSTLSREKLLDTLYDLMYHTKLTSYDDCRDYADETDCENGNGNIVTLYTSYTTTQGAYNSGNGWNREHVWPQDLGGFSKSGPGSDLHHIRPTENKTNNNRSNLKYGEVTGGKTSIGNLSGDVGGTYGGGYFEPLDNVKGDVARICLYVYVRWGQSGSYDCGNLTKVFSDIPTLLRWCEMDPVDTWEMGRNEVVYGIQGNRNVFIDYPELAWLVLGYDIPANMSTPSAGTGNGGSGNNGGSGTDKCSHASTSLVDSKAATCTENGYSGDVKCNNCKEIVTKGSVINAKGHSYGEAVTTKEPTEIESGTATKKCNNCTYEMIVIIPALGVRLPVEIVSNNVFYKNTLNLMYAVRADEGYDVALKIYNSENTLVEIITSYTLEDVNGEELKTFISSIGVPVQDIDTEFYAVAEISKNGTVEATSETERYSVLEYLYERLTVSKNVTDEQIRMYKTLLTFANSADVVINEDYENNIAQYAYVNVESGTVDGSYGTAMLKGGSTLSAVTSLGVVDGDLSWTVITYDFVGTPVSAVYTDASIKAGGLTIECGMAYLLIPSSSVVENNPVSSTETYTFADYDAGIQYADNEVHKLDGNTTVTTNDSYFTSELRIYASSDYDGYAVIESKKVITGISFNAGYKSDTLNVYGSVDGVNWVLIEGVSVSSAYGDVSVTVDFASCGYKYLKLDVAGSNQIRIKTITIKFDEN